MSWKDKFPEGNRYFETENGVLYCGDCLKIMERIPSESIDLVLTDPPYNIADNNKLTKAESKIKSNKDAWGDKFNDEWDSVEEYSVWLLEVIEQISHVLKETGNFISFFDRAYTGLFIYKIESETNFKFRNKLYFEKNNPLPHFRKNNYRSCIEEAIWFTKTHGGDYYINFISQEKMKQIFKGNIGKKLTKHPTEKYDWMIKPIIERHSKKDDLVLDPFLGSGTTAVVCEQLNRRWIGIEINMEYCDMVKKRILGQVRYKRALL